MMMLLQALFGRLPIGWLQLSHNKARLFAAVAGVGFANLLVFMQLGIMGALNGSTVVPYTMLDADVLISSQDATTLTDVGGNVARTRMFQALGTAGVADAMPVFIGSLPLNLGHGDSVSLLAFGVDVAKPAFVSRQIAMQLPLLQIENTALLDQSARGMPDAALSGLLSGAPYDFEVNGQTLDVVGTIKVGGGFLSDGTLVMSDQTFLRFFAKRSSGAPNHVLVKTADGVSPEVVMDRLQAKLPNESVKIQTFEQAAKADIAYMNTERPTGIIFGFGVIMGIIVGIVIVYQVLSTDVADHLREYATLKAMGYGHRFFLGIVFEEALVLAIFGFIPGFLASLGLYAMLRTVADLPVEMDVTRAVTVFVGTLVACTISGAIATRRLAGADPADLF